MAIDKINDILGRNIMQEGVNKATSGKKDNVQDSGLELRKAHLEDKTIFSQDARKLQETEVILQGALQKLREMDEINEVNLSLIRDKIDNDFYDNDEVLSKIVDDIFPERELRNTVEKRMKAEKYVEELNEYDSENELDLEKLGIIRERINSGYYDSSEVSERIAEDLLGILEV